MDYAKVFLENNPKTVLKTIVKVAKSKPVVQKKFVFEIGRITQKEPDRVINEILEPYCRASAIDYQYQYYVFKHSHRNTGLVYDTFQSFFWLVDFKKIYHRQIHNPWNAIGVMYIVNEVVWHNAFLIEYVKQKVIGDRWIFLKYNLYEYPTNTSELYRPIVVGIFQRGDHITHVEHSWFNWAFKILEKEIQHL